MNGWTEDRDGKVAQEESDELRGGMCLETDAHQSNSAPIMAYHSRYQELLD